MSNRDLHAFPTLEEKNFEGTNYIEYSNGMSLRDYFAGQIVTGLANGRKDKVSVFAEEAYMLADAMMKEREK